MDGPPPIAPLLPLSHLTKILLLTRDLNLLPPSEALFSDSLTCDDSYPKELRREISARGASAEKIEIAVGESEGVPGEARRPDFGVEGSQRPAAFAEVVQPELAAQRAVG